MPENNAQTAMYNQTPVLGWKHSGDKNLIFHLPADQQRLQDSVNANDANFLLHVVWRNMAPITQQAIVWVNGCQNTALARFAANRPTVFLLNFDEQTLFYVPIRLDAASVGQNTSCAVVCVRPVPEEPEYVHCSLIEGVYSLGDINHVSAQMMQTVSQMRF